MGSKESSAEWAVLVGKGLIDGGSADVDSRRDALYASYTRPASALGDRVGSGSPPRVARRRMLLSHGAGANLLRIAEEAVQNAVTHAEAKRIVIDLERAHDRLILHVKDDGRGMSGRSPSGRGTAVSCTVPLGITA